MGSSLDSEYSVTHAASKVTWCIPCIRWDRGGVSVKIDGGGTGWVVGWVYGRGFSRCMFVKGVLLGYFDGVFLGQFNGCKLGSSVGVSLENSEWTPDRRCGTIFDQRQ